MHTFLLTLDIYFNSLTCVSLQGVSIKIVHPPSSLRSPTCSHSVLCKPDCDALPGWSLLLHYWCSATVDKQGHRRENMTTKIIQLQTVVSRVDELRFAFKWKQRTFGRKPWSSLKCFYGNQLRICSV